MDILTERFHGKLYFLPDTMDNDGEMASVMGFSGFGMTLLMFFTEYSYMIITIIHFRQHQRVTLNYCYFSR